MKNGYGEIFSQYAIEEPQKLGAEINILIVEPHSEVRAILSNHLRSIGFPKVRAVNNGVDALRELSTQRANVILLSNEIECPTSAEFLAEIREDVRIKREIVILSTKPLSRERIMAAIEQGFDGLLIKPFALNDLVQKLKQAHAAFSNPNNSERIFEHAKDLLRKNELKIAEEVYNSLAKIQENSARPHVGLARIAQLNGEFEKAVSKVKIAIERNENYTHAFTLLGELYLKTGDYTSACSSFKRALELSPCNILTYMSAVDSLIDVGRIDDCIYLLNFAISADFEHPFIINRFGYCYFKKQNYQNAASYLERAVKLEPDNVSYINSLAICYRDAKLYDLSLKTYNSILKKDPDNYIVMFNKSLLLILMGRKDDAIKLVNRILLIKPDYTKARDKLREISQ